MAVLVTGVAGFIGHSVARALLARGKKVVGVDDLNGYYDVRLKAARLDDIGTSPAFRFLKLDFADLPRLLDMLVDTPISCIVHLGAQPGVRYSIENPAAYVRSNLQGHVNLLEIARAVRAKHMVYASSSSVYGGNEALPYSVSDPVDRPLSLYAASKRSDELISESYAHLFRIPLTGLRFFTVYGPWGRPDMAVWKFTQAILSSQPVPLFAGGILRRDFTYIDDITRGVIAALDRVPADDGREKPGGSRSPHAIYNLGNHRPEVVKDLVKTIEAATGMAAQTENLPMQAGDVSATYADIDLTTRDLGWRPTTDLSEGIPRFIEWYRWWMAAQN